MLRFLLLNEMQTQTGSLKDKKKRMEQSLCTISFMISDGWVGGTCATASGERAPAALGFWTAAPVTVRMDYGFLTRLI
jgi:hypothetical protein